MENKPLVSVITVCYNSEKYIKSTIESVLMQTYKNIEYIIIDGKSTDKTINIIREYNLKFNNKIKLISETDTGIYDAMNKGIDISCGDYLFFLNSGDYFLDKEIITILIKKSFRKNADFIYGPVKVGKCVLRKNYVKNKFNLIFKTICHQGILASRECFINNKFDVGYEWSADYQWILNCFENKKIKKIYINKVITYFDPKNNTDIEFYKLKKSKLKERLKIGSNSFKGIYRLIFLINQFRLLIKYNYFCKNNTFKD